MKVGEQALYLAKVKGMSTARCYEGLSEWFVKFGIRAWWEQEG